MIQTLSILTPEHNRNGLEPVLEKKDLLFQKIENIKRRSELTDLLIGVYKNKERRRINGFNK